jgi:hypothetical protein
MIPQIVVAATPVDAHELALQEAWPVVNRNTWRLPDGKPLVYLPVGTCLAGRDKGTLIIVHESARTRRDWREIKMQSAARGLVLVRPDFTAYRVSD